MRKNIFKHFNCYDLLIISFTIMAILIYLAIVIFNDRLYTESISIHKALVIDKLDDTINTKDNREIAITYINKNEEIICIPNDIYNDLSIGDFIYVKVYEKHKNDNGRLIKNYAKYYKLEED